MDADVTLASVLADGLHSVFQPVVDLDSDAVAGYEALMRGPAGSSLERPDQLLEEARRLGQLHVLDWAARERAVGAARGAGLRLPLSLIVNAEPEALGEPGEEQRPRCCSPDYRPRPTADLKRPSKADHPLAARRLRSEL